jgi:hypothetical protein
MANSLLTPTAVTREALRILHQKLNFVGNIERQYDSSFAKEGAKIGDSLKIRLPNQYTVRTGATLSTQDTTESSTTLQVSTQKGVDLNFTSVDLTMDMDDFSKRVLDPAMSVLAANIEADALNMYKDVYNVVDNDTNAITFKNILQGRQKLVDGLAPQDNNRHILLSTDHSVTLVDALKGLFQDSGAIKKQYKEGMMGRTGGFDFYENTLLTNHTTGTAAKTTGYLVNGASQTGASLTVDTGSTTFLEGDVITIAGVNRVHPETKADTGVLQQFVVTADSGASATSLSISPSIVTSGAAQNVSGSPADNAAVVKVGAGANELLNGTMAFHKEAFAFATADLIMPSGVDFAAREVYDGISMRIVRDYDINNDKFPCRIDVLYGYKTLRPEFAARIHADG